MKQSSSTLITSSRLSKKTRPTKIIMNIAVLLLLTLSQVNQVEADWELVTNSAQFSPRDTAEGVVFDGKMWLSNGWDPSNVPVRDLWYSVDGANWTLAMGDTPYDSWSEMVVYQNKIWAVRESVWNSPDGNTWTQVLDKTPFGNRPYGELVVLQDKMWQLGSGADVWNTTDGVNWGQVLAAAPFGTRYATATTAFNGKLWLMGGTLPVLGQSPAAYPSIITQNDVWCSDDGINWVRVLEHAPWSPRMWSVATVYAGKLWIIGGYDNDSQNLGDVWYTEDGTTWYELKSNEVFEPRHEVTPYVYNGSLWVVAGNTWPVKNDVWRLTIPAQVTPGSLNFGYVPVGSTKDLSLTVKNIGVETLTGTATTDAPFRIVSGGSYNLKPDENQVVIIQYQPTSQGPHTGTIAFTGGGGATVQVTGETEKSLGLPWLQLLLGD